LAFKGLKALTGVVTHAHTGTHNEYYDLAPTWMRLKNVWNNVSWPMMWSC